MNWKRTQSGFTLIELMIVTAIIAILAAVAYPSYTDSVRKGRRSEGRTALMELMQQQERFMTQRNTYASWTTPGATTGTAALFKTFSGDSAASGAYLISATDCTGGTDATKLRECVQLNAVPRVTDAQAGTLQLSSTGQKTCTGSNPTVCWK